MWGRDSASEGDFINYQLREKKLGVADTSYMGKPGLEERVQRGEHLSQEASLVKERELLSSYFENLQKDNGLSVYGLANVRKALDLGAVDKLLVSEENFDYFSFPFTMAVIGLIIGLPLTLFGVVRNKIKKSDENALEDLADSIKNAK